MMQKPRFTAAVALCAAALLQGAAAFQIWMSTNELPDDLNRRADEWVEAKSLVQGLIGPAAPHPTDPMPNRIDEGRVRAKFMQSFGDVPRILTQSWDQWAPTNGEGIFEKFETLGFDADEVLLWGLDDDIGPDIRMTLSTGQLDKVASSPVVDEALILVKSFGPDLKYQDQLTVRTQQHLNTNACILFPARRGPPAHHPAALSVQLSAHWKAPRSVIRSAVGITHVHPHA